MSVKMKAPQVDARYRLTLYNYPDDQVIPSVCKVLYGSAEKNLIATLGDLPYRVGRSFDLNEAEQLHKDLERLDVGHSFEGPSDTQKNLAYKSNANDGALKLAGENRSETRETSEAKSSRLPAIFSRALFSRKRIFLTLAAMAVVGIALGIFVGMNPKAVGESDKQGALNHTEIGSNEALLESFTRDVESRKAKEVVWRKVEAKLILNQLDAIRTFEKSDATIRYREGSRVMIRENTLMIVGENSDDDGEHRKIELKDGAIHTRLKSSLRGSHLSIQTASGTLELTSPSTENEGLENQDQETEVQTSIKDGQLEVAVTEGTAVLKPLGKDRPQVELKKLQKLTATATSVTAPEEFIPEILAITPADDTRLEVDSQTLEQNILFQWRAVEEKEMNATPYELILATDREMKSILLSQNTNSTELRLSYLDLGTLYWKVQTRIRNTPYESKVRRLYVEKKPEH